jgi:hypothetical protein
MRLFIVYLLVEYMGLSKYQIWYFEQVPTDANTVKKLNWFVLDIKLLVLMLSFIIYLLAEIILQLGCCIMPHDF